MKMSYKTLSRLVQKLRRGFYTSSRRKSESDRKAPQGDCQGANDGKKNDVALPPEPTYCCMSGCDNCVWIKYAQELAQTFHDGDVRAREIILQKVHDPNHRAFLFTNLGLNETKSGN